MARQRRYRTSDKKRDLYRYRLGRAVNDAFSMTRGKMRAAIGFAPTGAYDPLSLWDNDWWMAAVDRHIAPALWQIYWDSAADAAEVANREVLASYPVIVERWRAQVQRLYLYGDTVRRRVDVVSDQGTGETKGWMLDKLGLVAAAGPLSDGIAEGMVDTEELAAVEGGTSAGLGGNGTKTWIASGPNPRETHAAADGQQVGFDEPFNVGGYDCLYPGDSDLPPEERVNCYCSVEYAFEAVPSEASILSDLGDLIPDVQLASVAEEIVAEEVVGWQAGEVVPASDSIDTTLRKNPTGLSSTWADTTPLAQRGNIKVVQAGVDEVTALIDSVHGMPADLPPVTWHQIPNSVAQDGEFTTIVRRPTAADDWVSPRYLAVRGNTEILHEVIAHESGHYFDWANFDTPPGTWASGKVGGTGGFWRSGVWQPVSDFGYVEVSPALQGVMDAITASPEWRELASVLQAVDSPGIGFGNVSTRTFDYLRYLTNPQEMFARAYAQFIAVETGDVTMLANIARGIGADIPTQWAAESFGPIQDAFRAMFRSSGLAA